MSILSKLPKEEKELYINKSAMIEKYQLTAGFVKLYLTTPDLYIANYKYKSGHPVCMYLITRVEQVLVQHADKIKPKRPKKSQEELDLINEKKQTTRHLKYVANVESSLSSLHSNFDISVPLDILSNRARTSWFNYKHQYNQDTFDRPSEVCMIVNYLRHHCTNYDDVISNIAYLDNQFLHILWLNVYALIVESYPMYFDECNRQLLLRGIPQQIINNKLLTYNNLNSQVS